MPPVGQLRVPFLKKCVLDTLQHNFPKVTFILSLLIWREMVEKLHLIRMRLYESCKRGRLRDYYSCRVAELLSVLHRTPGVIGDKRMTKSWPSLSTDQFIKNYSKCIWGIEFLSRSSWLFWMMMLMIMIISKQPTFNGMKKAGNLLLTKLSLLDGAEEI